MVGRLRLLTGDDLLLPPDSLEVCLDPKLRGFVEPWYGDSFAVEGEDDEGRDSIRVGIIRGVGEDVWRGVSISIDGFSDACTGRGWCTIDGESDSWAGSFPFTTSDVATAGCVLLRSRSSPLIGPWVRA